MNGENLRVPAAWFYTATNLHPRPPPVGPRRPGGWWGGDEGDAGGKSIYESNFSLVRESRRTSRAGEHCSCGNGGLDWRSVYCNSAKLTNTKLQFVKQRREEALGEREKIIKSKALMRREGFKDKKAKIKTPVQCLAKFPCMQGINGFYIE